MSPQKLTGNQSCANVTKPKPGSWLQDQTQMLPLQPCQGCLHCEALSSRQSLLGSSKPHLAPTDLLTTVSA